MNPSKFDKIVQNRAQQRVEELIRVFRQEVSMAIYKLTATREAPQNNCRWYEGESAKELFASLATNKWPAYLWETQTEKVTAELLSTMDEMQKALIAPDPSITPETPHPIVKVSP